MGDRRFSIPCATAVSIEKMTAVRALQAGIFPENVASLALHVGQGFRTLGVCERPGCLNGRWRDVVLPERRGRRVWDLMGYRVYPK